MPPPRYKSPVTAPCATCGRPFTDGRRQEHELICARLAHRRRPGYDSQQQRLAGTEHEQLFRRAQHRPPPPVRESRWRQRHEDLVTAVRAARQVQAHLAAGGRPQDLPPPPPSDYSDYIQCPYCSRKFNETAAERHIPRCQSYEHNKPGPSGAGRGRGGPQQTDGGGRPGPRPAGTTHGRSQAAPAGPAQGASQAAPARAPHVRGKRGRARAP